MGTKTDHVVVEKLIAAADAGDESILRAVTNVGIDRALHVIFTELFLDFDPGPHQNEALAIQYDLSFCGMAFSHHVNVDRHGPAVRRGTCPDAPLRISHTLPQFLAFYRAVLGEPAVDGVQQMIDALLTGAEGGTGPVWLRGLRDCFDDNTDLSGLAARAGTDKWGVHWYTRHYDRFFRPLRGRAVRVLEIGIDTNPRSGGASLAMWKRYFRRGTICAIDPRARTFPEQQRVRVFQGDQADRRFLESTMDAIGPVDIIIDDGSHRCADVIASFGVLFPYLRAGGIYAVEDLHTSYWPGFGGSSVDLDNPRTSMGYLKTLLDGINHEDFVPAGTHTPSYTDRNVVGVHFFRNLALIEKGTNADGPDWVVPEQLRLSADAVAAAHADSAPSPAAAGHHLPIPTVPLPTVRPPVPVPVSVSVSRPAPVATGGANGVAPSPTSPRTSTGLVPAAGTGSTGSAAPPVSPSGASKPASSGASTGGSAFGETADREPVAGRTRRERAKV